MGAREGVLSVVLSLCAVPIVVAQSVSPLPSHPIAIPDLAPAVGLADEQLLRLTQWTRAYREWRAWYLQWRNQPEPGMFGVRARRDPPVPPAWLPTVCAGVVEEAGPVAEACAAWREWQANDMAATLMTEQIAQARAAVETPHKTLWWERVHVDALWPMTRAGSNAFGVVGVHTTIHVTKRFQVFLLPGVILMRAPGLDGVQNWSAATDWGFSFRLFDLRVPLAARPGTVHLNMARVWMFGASGVATTGETYLAGLSLSFKQR